jgi:glycosyltransferase involved in cell wall biosynthesis
MPRVLIVAYYFPPLGGIGSVRVSSFANYLPERGWDVRVLAPRDGAYYRDPELLFPEEQVIRSGSFEISRTTKRVLRAGGDDVKPARAGSLQTRLRAAARRFLYYPDAQVGWYLPAVQAGLRVLRDERFDAIFSSAYPITAHLVARRLQARSGLPWVAEYRDPFSDLIETDAVNHRRALRLERSVAERSAGIVMTSPSWAGSHENRWGQSVRVITNGCDQAADAHTSSDAFVLGHLGTMFPERQDLGAVWGALRILRNEHEIDAMRFVGDIQPEVRTELHEAGLDEIVDETGFLPRPEASRRLIESSALLLAGPLDDRPVLRGWIPAKLFEYLATDLPIIYMGDPDSDAANILRQHEGCEVLVPGDRDGAMRALRSARGRRFTRDIHGLTRRALTADLAALLDHVAGVAR